MEVNPDLRKKNLCPGFNKINLDSNKFALG